MKPTHVLLAALLCMPLVPVALAQPQATSALINEQLDKLIELKLNNSPLPQVIKSIADQTGVPIRVTDDVYSLLPYGTQTPITATISNLSLRDALVAMCGKLGLRVDLRDEYVELSPEPALRRVGRRATLQELGTLDLLSRQKLPAGAAQEDVLALTHRVDSALAKVQTTPPLVVEVRPGEGVELSKQLITLPRDATLSAALEAISEQTKLTWYPWGDSVVILPKKSVIRGQLERSVSLRYDGVDIAQVLTDLSKRTGLPFMIEPGAIQRVSPEFRIVKLSADAPVRQALESLQGYTGLGYVVTDEGVYIWNQNSTPAGARGRVVATIEAAPGTSVLVYEDDLSPAARDALKAQRQDAIQSFQRWLEGQAQPPATQPAHN